MKIVYILLAVLLFSVSVGYSQNIPRPNIDAPAGLQVNTYTGNLFCQRTDMVLKGTGLPINLQFSYNASTDTMDWGYGYGWTCAYNIGYEEISGATVIQRGDGKQDTFLTNGANFISPAGVFDILTKSGATYTLRSKSGLKHFFADASHKKVTMIEDPNGNALNFTYTGNDLTGIANESGRNVSLAWTNGHLSSLTDNTVNPPRTIIYMYDDKDDLVAVTDPLGSEIAYSYQQHNLTQAVDENVNPVVITYYSDGKVDEIISCLSNQKFTFLDSPRRSLLAQRGSSGTQVTSFAFDNKGRIIKVTDALGYFAAYQYDEDNNITQFKDFNGHATQYLYDGTGNLIREIDPMGGFTEYSYEPVFNNVTSVKDKRGNTSNFTYDSQGNLTGINRPLGVSESYAYSSNGLLTSIQNGNNHTTSFQYNAQGDLIKVVFPVGEQNFEYDPLGNLKKIIDANGNAREFTYDRLDRLTSLKDALNNTTTYQYDDRGNLIEKIDPNGNSTLYGYDQLNRLKSVTLPIGTWNYEYDGLGNLTKLTDANGHVTAYQYDAKSRLIKETDPLGHSTAYTYDGAGNVLSRLDANGNTTTYSYDLMGRITSRAYVGNTDYYGYDASGNMTSAYNFDITYTFEYDALGRMTKKDIPTWGKMITYTYDALGNRISMTDPDGGVTTYEYDVNNRLSGLTNPENLNTTFEYDLSDRLIRQNNANGTYTTYHYNTASLLDSLINWKSGGQQISFFFYTYDQFGNRITTTDIRGIQQHTYDASHRLTNVVYADGTTESFTMDGSGNRISRIINIDTTLYTYNTADQIQTDGNNTFTFDENGNLVSQSHNLQSNTYAFDGLNRLAEAEINTENIIRFKYDPFGNKIEKNDTSSVYRYILDGNNIIMEINNNILEKKYTTGFYFDAVLSVLQNSSTHFYLKDGLNSVTEIIDSFQNILNAYSYDAFGSLNIIQEIVDNNILYTSRPFEKDISLIDLRSRFYNPNLGRFMNKDYFAGVLDNPLTINRYTYTGNNPINFQDPEGFWIWPAIQIIGSLATAYSVYKFGKAVKDKADKTKRIENCIKELKSKGIDPTLYIANNINQADDFRILVENTAGLPGTSLNPSFTPYNTDVKFNNSRLQKVVTGRHDGEISLGLETPYTLKSVYNFIMEDIESLLKDIRGQNNSAAPCCCSDGDQTPPSGVNTPPTSITIPAIVARDPNEIIAPEGYGDEHWVSGTATLPYKVLFENDPDFATAPAQKVVIKVPLDLQLNQFSLRVGEFGFGDFVFQVPENATFYQNRLDVRDSLGVYVDVTAGLDVTKREAFWVFQSIDPATNLPSTLPADVGFLPINDSISRQGEGFVTFTIQPASSAITGDTITEQASIVFDINAPLPTNIETNLVDAFPPVSTIDPLPATTDTNCITLTFTGQDDTGGVGLATFDLYVARDSGAFVLYKENIDTSSVEFCGDLGSTYHFYTRATDLVGNEEAPKLAADESITLSSGATSVSGRIIWEATRLTTMTGVNDASVALNGDANDADTTVTNGNFVLNAATGANFTITPVKNKPMPFAINGLTAADASRIQQHALGSFPFNDPYKLIAADVNKNNSVTSQDANLVMQAVLGNPIAQAFFINTTWRFVPKSYVFPVPANPWGFPEMITLADTSGIIVNQDFIGSKLGDVNNSANPNNLVPGQSPSLLWKLKDRVLMPDTYETVEFNVYSFNALLAYQFALRFDTAQMQLMNIETIPGSPINDGHFGTYNLKAGEIRAGLALGEPISLPDGTPVFRLSFKVLKGGSKLSDVLHLDHAILKGEAYSGNYTSGPVDLIYDLLSNTNEQDSDTLVLMQNRPNPFGAKTVIGFVLPGACEAQIRVFDAKGVLIEEQKRDFAKGYHEITFPSVYYTGEGVLYYELTTPFGVISKEMLRIRNK